ncbi:MAG: type I-C CRISPR-associated endonuclease Cas1 [Spirochaetales bacterium]|nr:type I-C CRISPR-associated endonuclease Cas1 [Spirochaetales bacterium]
MRKLLNTLYITSQGTYVHKEGETVVVEKDQKKVLQLPIHTLQGLVCFGNVLCSPFLLGFCAERGITVTYLTENGRFLAAVNGPQNGNVLLRKEQYRRSDDAVASRNIAAPIVVAKITNARTVLSRFLRDHSDRLTSDAVHKAVVTLSDISKQVSSSEDIDTIRGFEGQAAAVYFSVFNELILDQKEDFVFVARNRRPPLDPINAMLSFTYTLVTHDMRSALETVGLDPAVGFLHRDRPGRPSLALDLIEEFRNSFADRLVLSIINRRQVSRKGFTFAENGAVSMDTETRKTLLVEYQTKKQQEVTHPFLGETVPIGLLFFLQANLLARYLRGDLDGYPPFFWR